jgi:hypothetical protein
VVEATYGCDINPGKYAKQEKSTKFVKQILSTYTRIPVISKLAKDSQRVRETKTLDESFQISNYHEILHAKRQGGGGCSFFSIKTSLFP